MITDEFADRLPLIQRSVGRMETTFLNEERTIKIPRYSYDHSSRKNCD